MSETPQRVSCPGCTKGYRWSDTMVGRQVACKNCGEQFTVPGEPGEGQPLADTLTDDGTYALDLGESDRHPDAPRPLAVEANQGKCPGCNQKLSQNAVLCLNCGFSLEAGRHMGTAVVTDDDEKDTADNTRHAPNTVGLSRRAQLDGMAEKDALKEYRFTDIYLPLGLIVAGVIMIAGYSIYASNGDPLIALGMFGGLILIQVVITAPLLILALFVASAIAGVSYGTFWTALLKAAGIALGPGLLADLILALLAPYIFGIRLLILLAGVLYICLTGPFLSKMFDLDGREVSITVATFLVVKFAGFCVTGIAMYYFFS